MMKRSLLALAAGILASMALAAPSHAGTVTVTGSWSVPGATATEVDFFFSAPVTAIVSSTSVPATPAGVGSIPPPPPNEVIFTYTPATVGSALTFTVDTTGVFLTGEVNGASIMGTPTEVNFNFVPASVPEPTSVALLGIGMTGFLAFRRLFKRTAVA
jgi:hypothetical protein